MFKTLSWRKKEILVIYLWQLNYVFYNQIVQNFCGVFYARVRLCAWSAPAVGLVTCDRLEPNPCGACDMWQARTQSMKRSSKTKWTVPILKQFLENWTWRYPNKWNFEKKYKIPSGVFCWSYWFLVFCVSRIPDATRKNSELMILCSNRVLSQHKYLFRTLPFFLKR